MCHIICLRNIHAPTLLSSNMSLLTATTPFLEYVPLNAEYDSVSKALSDSLGRTDICISVLLKVKNPTLAENFATRAASIEAVRGTAPKVATMYHGTTMTAAELIAESGFDKAFSRTAAFGKGTYASPSVKTALQYCRDVKKKEDFSMVFQCKFLKGVYGCAGSNTEIDTKICDYSGDKKTIFVTPYNDGILPEYLICYYSWA
jgi:hypothetical protein